eukprot:281678-Pelagomonas_calceolata.AAC.2
MHRTETGQGNGDGLATGRMPLLACSHMRTKEHMLLHIKLPELPWTWIRQGCRATPCLQHIHGYSSTPTCDLGHGPLRGQVAVQDLDVAGCLDGGLHRQDHILACLQLRHLIQVLTEGLACKGQGGGVNNAEHLIACSVAGVEIFPMEAGLRLCKTLPARVEAFAVRSRAQAPPRACKGSRKQTFETLKE